MTVAWSASARAEGPTDYCQKVTARAESDAALLIAPTVHAQLVRFPNGSAVDPSGFQIGRGFQPRAALSLSFIDIYKGFGVLDVAKADCLRQQTASTLEEVVAQRADIGRAPALERKLAYLRSNEAAVKELVRNAEERFAAHTTTIAEVQDVRLHSLSFARRLADTERELAAIKARGLSMPAQPLAEILRTYEERTVAVENDAAHVRNLAPWKFTVTGGVAATPRADYFGVAELSYNLGGLFSVGSERNAVEARANELKNARYEMRQQVETITRELRVNAEHSRQQAKVLEDELLRMSKDRASLDGAEAPNKHTLVATMTLQMIELESEHTFLVAYAEKQAAVGGSK
jgi:prophage DNA circulation protein